MVRVACMMCVVGGVAPSLRLMRGEDDGVISPFLLRRGGDGFISGFLPFWEVFSLMLYGSRNKCTIKWNEIKRTLYTGSSMAYCNFLWSVSKGNADHHYTLIFPNCIVWLSYHGEENGVISFTYLTTTIVLQNTNQLSLVAKKKTSPVLNRHSTPVC